MPKEIILKKPRHELYGFSALKKGETLVLTPDFGDTLQLLRAHVNGFATYHGVKFKTTITGAEKSQLAVVRVK